MQAPINYFFFSMGSHEFVLSEGCFTEVSYYTGLQDLTGKVSFINLRLLFALLISKLLEVTIFKEVLSSFVIWYSARLR